METFAEDVWFEENLNMTDDDEKEIGAAEGSTPQKKSRLEWQ